jgi:hypothetical protein
MEVLISMLTQYLLKAEEATEGGVDIEGELLE